MKESTIERLTEHLCCGTIVKTKIGKIEAMITCKSVRFDKVQYELTYFTNNEFKTTWMCDGEFDVVTSKHSYIGFANNHKSIL